VAGLRQGGPDERWSAARSLAGRADGEATLNEALAGEVDPRVREALFTSLAGLPDGAGLAAVAGHLHSDDAERRTGALDALRAIGPAVGPMLPALLRDPDPDVRVLACELARQAPAEEGAALLCERLDADPEPNVCAAAVDVLAEIGDAGAAPALSRCAARFGDRPFLGFAIRVALDRIADAKTA
jgi:HEAT repeat protein